MGRADRRPALGTGGSGDILAGMVAAEVAGADDVPAAAARAAWCHGFVGDMAGREHLGRGNAADLLRLIPDALPVIADLADRRPRYPLERSVHNPHTTEVQPGR